MAWPPNATSTSPACNPAVSAAEPGITCCTRTPSPSKAKSGMVPRLARRVPDDWGDAAGAPVSSGAAMVTVRGSVRSARYPMASCAASVTTTMPSASMVDATSEGR